MEGGGMMVVVDADLGGVLLGNLNSFSTTSTFLA